MDVDIKNEFEKLHVRLDQMISKADFDEFAARAAATFLSKADFDEFAARVAATFLSKADFDEFAARVAGTVVTKVELDMFKEDLFERMATKQQYSDHMTLMDKAVREAKNAREDQLLQSNRFVDLDDQVQGHEKRIKKLEKAVV